MAYRADNQNPMDVNGKAAGDISEINNISNSEDQSKLITEYDELGKQISTVANNAYNNVVSNQAKRIGNDFGDSQYNFNTYYQGGIADARSTMHVEGTQRAFQNALENAKNAAESAYTKAQSNLSNAIAAQNAKAVYATGLESGTSAQELIKHAAQGSSDADEAYNKIAGNLTTDNIITDWEDKESRSKADQAAFAVAKSKGLVDQNADLEDQWGAEWWKNAAVSNEWNSTYAYNLLAKKRGIEIANTYRENFNHNYQQVKSYFDYFTGAVSELPVINALRTMKFKGGNNSVNASGIKVSFSKNGNDIESIIYRDEKGETKKALTNNIKNVLGDEYQALVDEYKSQADEYQKTVVENKVAMAFSEKKGFSDQYYSKAEIETKLYDDTNALVESAFGFDLESGWYLTDLKANSPDTYDALLHDFSMVLTYGEIYEVADGETTYHTAEGDQVLEKGTYVYYTLPGMENDPDLKEMIDLRNNYDKATTGDQEKYEEAYQAARERYMSTVTAALFVGNSADCAVTENVTNAVIYSKDQSNGDLEVFAGKTAKEVIAKFNEIYKRDAEDAYHILVNIINKSAANSGSYWARVNNELKSESIKDEKGRDKIGATNNSFKGKTLFSDNDMENLTVEDAIALYTVIGTSMNKFNEGNTNGNINPEFLKNTGQGDFHFIASRIVSEGLKGIIGIVDLVGNALWAGLVGLPAMAYDLANGGDGSNATELAFNTKRWWGWGGLTGNLTGNYSLYEQFVGEYKEGTLGYGLSNENRMVENMLDVVTPVLNDVFWNENYDVGDIRSIGNNQWLGYQLSTIGSTIGGLVVSVAGPALIAKGATAGISAVSKKFATVAAKKLSAKTAMAVLATNNADDYINAANKLAANYADDIVDVAANYTDDAVNKIANNADDVINAAANNADDVANILADKSDDVVMAAKNEAANSIKANVSSFSKNSAAISRTTNIEDLAKGSDELIKTLGSLANASDEVLSSSLDDFVKYGKEAIKAAYGGLGGVSEDLFDDALRRLGDNITRRTARLAYVSAFTGAPIDDVANLSDDVLAFLSSAAYNYTDDAAGKVVSDVVAYTTKMDQASLQHTLNSIITRSKIAEETNQAFTMDDVVRMLAHEGWDAKNISIMAKDYFKDRVTDYVTDIMHGYMLPEVTNEGTDRETFDEYISNPLNFVTNEGFFIVQHGGKKLFRRAISANAEKSLAKAQRALDVAYNSRDLNKIEKAEKKVATKLANAIKAADNCLDKGISYAELSERVEVANKQMNSAIATLDSTKKGLMDASKFGVGDASIKSFSEALSGRIPLTEEAVNRHTAGMVKAYSNYSWFQKNMGFDTHGIASIDDTDYHLKLTMAMINSREAYLRMIKIKRGGVTEAQQKKIYKAMIDGAVEWDGGRTLGLRDSLDFYFKTILEDAKQSKLGIWRAGYLPVEGYFEMDIDDVEPYMRGFALGNNILNPATANPALERSISLSDKAIVQALLDGEDVVTLRDVDGNILVDEAGDAITKEITPKGANLLNMLQTRINAGEYHRQFDDIFGSNPADVGEANLRQGTIVIRAQGAQNAVMQKDYDRAAMDVYRMEDKAFGTKKAEAERLRRAGEIDEKTAALVTGDKQNANELATNVTATVEAASGIDTLKAKKTQLTDNQNSFVGVRVFKYVDDNGVVDVKAGQQVYDHFAEIVKQDLASFQDGEIPGSGGFIVTDYYDFSNFAWKYNKNFGRKVDGVIQSAYITPRYYEQLVEAAKTGTIPRDMVINRLLMTYAAYPLNESDMSLYKIVGSNGTVYPWVSPLKEFDSDFIPGASLDTIEAVKGFRGESLSKYNFNYTEKLKDGTTKVWTRKDFNDFTVTYGDNLTKAKTIVLDALMDNNVVGYSTTNVDGKVVKKPYKNAKIMVDEAAARVMVDTKGSVDFETFVEKMQNYLPRADIYAETYANQGALKDITVKLNQAQANGMTAEGFLEWEAARINKGFAGDEDITNQAKALTFMSNIVDHEHRAAGLGEGFVSEEVSQADDVARNLYNDSEYAVAQNAFHANVEGTTSVIPTAGAAVDDVMRTANSPLSVAGKNVSSRAKEAEIANLMKTSRAMMDSTEAFLDHAKAFQKEFDEYISSAEHQARVKDRKTALNDVMGYTEKGTKKHHEGILEKADDIIIDSAKYDVEITNKIAEYRGITEARSKGGNAGDGFYGISAYAGHPIKEGFSKTGTPSQYRSAMASMDLYKSNKEVLDAFDYNIENAVSKAERSELIAKKNEYVRSFGVDFSGNYNYKYSIGMLESGCLEGKLAQTADALSQVEKSLLHQYDILTAKGIAADSKEAKALSAQINKVIDYRKTVTDYISKLPETETLAYALKNDNVDSLELAFTTLMADVDGNPIDQAKKYVMDKSGKVGMFTQEQLNALAGASKKDIKEGAAIAATPKKVSFFDVDNKGNKVLSNAEVYIDPNVYEMPGGGSKNVLTIETEDGISIDADQLLVVDNSRPLDVELERVDNNAIAINEALEGTGFILSKRGENDGPREVYGWGDYVLEEKPEDKVTLEYENTSGDQISALQYNAETAYNEWLQFTSDIEELDKKIDAEVKKLETESKTAAKKVDDAASKKVEIANENGEPEKLSFKDIKNADDVTMRKRLSDEDYNTWKRAKDQLSYIKERLAGDSVYRSYDGHYYLPDNAMNIEGYSKLKMHKDALGFVPKGEEAPEVDVKADKKATKALRRDLTKQLHAGDQIPGRQHELNVPGADKLDSASKKLTLDNLVSLEGQVLKATGFDLTDEDILINNDLVDLLTRIDDNSMSPTKFQKFNQAMCNMASAIQNIQMAGGFGPVNALTLAQWRGAIMSDPIKMVQYLKTVADVKNSASVKRFFQKNMDRLGEFAYKFNDMSILNDSSRSISAKPGATDGGVTQKMITNLLGIKEDWADVRAKNRGEKHGFMRSILDLAEKDVQQTIFEESTFQNALPVLRAKMLIANYDSAVNLLKNRFAKDLASGKVTADVLEEAAYGMSYGKTLAFFSPHSVIGQGDLQQVLDRVRDKSVRDFTAKIIGAKSQTTILETLTNFFFALRYKMQLSGRFYDAFASGPLTAKNMIVGRAGELSEDTLNAIGTAFMHSGSEAALGTMMATAVVAAATATALGIPTALDDVSVVDEYDGSFKVPDIFQKFQSIGQIWLPNAYSDEKGLYVDPTEPLYGLDTMSSIFTLQNSIFRTIDKSINPEQSYAAPQRGIGLHAGGFVNNLLNTGVGRALGDELLGSNLLSPFKAMYEVVIDSTYFGNNIWEKKYLPDGTENPNYDFGRNVAASVMHILGLDHWLDAGKGYNDWVKGKVDKDGNLLTPYVAQDQVGTVAGSGVLQHEFLTAARAMIDGDYLDAITEAGELPIKTKNLSSQARTEFNNRVKNIIAKANAEYKLAVKNAKNNDEKDAAYATYAKKAADAVTTWSKKYGYVLGKDQSLVASTTRIYMAMLSGEYDDNMAYVQNAYWKAGVQAQIAGGKFSFLNDEDLPEWIASGRTAEEFAAEKEKRSKAYNDALDDEYEARKAMIANGYSEEFLKDYAYSDVKAEQRAINKKVFTEVQAKLDSKIGQFDNYKEMKSYYESQIDAAYSKSQKAKLAEKYNAYVFDVLAPYVDEETGYGAAIIKDGYYNNKGLSTFLADYVILPANKYYNGKSPVANYIQDYFGVGYNNGQNLPSDSEIYEKFITAQNLMMKGSVASSIAVLDKLIDAVKNGDMYASDADYSKIINMRAILSARR